MNRQQIREVFHEKVLQALDDAAKESLFFPDLIGNPGSANDDLPRLFDAINHQVDVIIDRYEIPLDDNNSGDDDG